MKIPNTMYSKMWASLFDNSKRMGKHMGKVNKGPGYMVQNLKMLTHSPPKKKKKNCAKINKTKRCLYFMEMILLYQDENMRE